MKRSTSRPRSIAPRHPRKPRAARSGKVHPAAHLDTARGEPRMCERCGAVYEHKRWRAAGGRAAPSLVGARWTVCPACRQQSRAVGLGRVRILGRIGEPAWQAIEQRLRNVAARAQYTQSQRRIVDIAPVAGAIEVLTTSQKLAHRLGRELQKAFGGRARYRWSPDDGALLVQWRVPPGLGARRPGASPPAR